MPQPAVTLADIEAARQHLAGKVSRTPVIRSDALSEIMGVSVWLKLDHRQPTGSFKLRGATNAIASLSPAQRQLGVTTASTGNHGRALAYAAKLEGMRSIICMSDLVPANKVSEIKRLGAEIRIIGKSQDDAQIEAERLAAEEDVVIVPPFDHPAVIAGQGTIGLEIIEDVPDVATVIVPLSGGGLISGIAAAMKGRNNRIKVIGVSMARGAAMKASLDAGRPVLVEELPTLADSLGGGIGLDNRLTFKMVRDLVDDVVLLSEDEIAEGIRHAYAQEREIVEGAAAVGIAALLVKKVKVQGPAVVLLSGRNIDMNLHRSIIAPEDVALGVRAS
jgi:threonine dehydratase